MNWLTGKVLITGISALLILSCKDKKENKEQFFPALSFIQSQVAHVDTSIYTIRKVVFNDSTGTDTIYIPREQFRKEAADFLSIPDISLSKYAKKYTEVKDFDPTLNRVMMVYSPVNPANEEIQRQEILIKPDSMEGDKITSIFIYSVTNSGDSQVEKKLLWQVDKSFQVTAITSPKNGPEKTSTFKVIWNEEGQQ
jgi:hypothetical protein